MITYIQIVLGVLLVVAILLQQRGTGMSSLMGGGSLEYSTKRGAEKVIFTSTIVIGTLFIVALIVGPLL
jgi:protein translocase SecG subunit